MEYFAEININYTLSNKYYNTLNRKNTFLQVQMVYSYSFAFIWDYDNDNSIKCKILYTLWVYPTYT